MKLIPNCQPTSKPLRIRVSAHTALFGCLLLLGGCTSEPPRSLGTVTPVDTTTVNALSNNLAAESAKLSAAQDSNLANIERHAPAQAEPQPVAPQHDPLEDTVVTVNLHSASLSNVLQVLGMQSKMNLLVDSDVLAINKRASFYLNNVTAREFFQDVLSVYDLAGHVEGNTIKIGLYEQRLFNLDFLNTSIDMNIASGGNVFGSMSSGGSSGSSSGGSGGGNMIRGDINLQGGHAKKTDPYSELEGNLKQILGTKDGRADNKRDNDADLMAKLPVTQSEQGSGGDDDRRNMGAVYSLNRSSGTLYVNARPSQMRMIEKLVGRYAKVLGRQVLIEAQLLDLELNDQFQYGVDWNFLRHNLSGLVGGAPMVLTPASVTLPTSTGTGMPLTTLTFPTTSVGSTAGNALAAVYSNNVLSAALSMLRDFGNVKVLSNPEVRVRNNTPALLSVGTSNRIISQSTITTSNPGGGASTISANVQTDSVFSGIIIGVEPFIGDNGNIDLLINPMQTQVDPNSLELQDVGGGNKVTLPQISYKGMTTTLHVKDGDTVIIGGLIDQKVSRDNAGLPGASDIPILGKLFGNESHSHKSSELIIVLRVKEL